MTHQFLKMSVRDGDEWKFVPYVDNIAMQMRKMELPINPVLQKAQFEKVDLHKSIKEEINKFIYKTPSAMVIKGVSIPVGWRKKLLTYQGTMIRVGTGRSMVNPCEACEMAEMTGTDGYCGQCRSRPRVRSLRTIQADDGFPLTYSIYLFSLSAHGLARSGDSPRTSYERNLEDFTCPKCKTIYHGNMREHYMIETVGGCHACSFGTSE